MNDQLQQVAKEDIENAISVLSTTYERLSSAKERNIVQLDMALQNGLMDELFSTADQKSQTALAIASSLSMQMLNEGYLALQGGTIVVKRTILPNTEEIMMTSPPDLNSRFCWALSAITMVFVAATFVCLMIMVLSAMLVVFTAGATSGVAFVFAVFAIVLAICAAGINEARKIFCEAGPLLPVGIQAQPNQPPVLVPFGKDGAGFAW